MTLYKNKLDFELPADMKNLVSDRLHPVYRNLIAFRNNELWGFVPPNDVVFDFFESISEYTSVNRILEFGYCLGYSASYQLTVHPNASLDTYDVRNRRGSTNIYDPNDTFDVESLAYEGNHFDLGLLVWGKRLTIHHEKSFRSHLNHSPGEFDYVFIDGDHTEQGLRLDIEQAKLLKIPFVVIDNLDQLNVLSKVVEEYKELGLLKEIKRIKYNTFFPGRENLPRKPHPDALALFELML